jgi:hypothetical protein
MGIKIIYTKQITITEEDAEVVTNNFKLASKEKKLTIMKKLANIKMEEIIAEIYEGDYDRKTIDDYFDISIKEVV